MSWTKPFLAFTTTIMGVAFPLIIKTVSEIGNMYNSNAIIRNFKNERTYKCFIYLLIVSVTFATVSIVYPPSQHIKMWEIWLYLASGVIYQASMILTVIQLFRIIFLVMKYYDPVEYGHYVHKKYLNSGKYKGTQKEQDILKALFDIIISSIEAKREDIVDEVSDIVSVTFYHRWHSASIHDNRSMYLGQLNRLFRTYMDKGDEMFSSNVQALLSHTWFKIHGVDEYLDCNILSLTRSYLTDLVQKDRVSQFMRYWEMADTLVRDYKYKNKLPDDILYDDKVSVLLLHWLQEQQISHLSIETPTLQGDDDLDGQDAYLSATKDNPLFNLLRYVGFHIVLGGLIVHQHKYSFINRMFDFSSSMPYQYHLLPDTFKEIFRLYWISLDSNGWFYNFQPLYVVFPDLEGVNQEEITIGNTLIYIVVLYLRLYTLYPKYHDDFRFGFPQMPSDRSILYSWKQTAESLRRSTEIVMNNSDLIQGIGIDRVIDNKKQEMLGNLDELVAKIVSHIDSSESNYTPDQNTLDMINSHVTSEIVDVIDRLQPIINNDTLTANYSSWFTEKSTRVIDKDLFYSEDHHFIKDTVTHPIITHIQNIVHQSFRSQAVTKYTLNRKDIFTAVERLKPDKSNYVLVTFNMYLPYYIDTLGVIGLSFSNDNYEYNGLRLYSYNDSSRHSDSSIFVVHEDDLPRLVSHDCIAREVQRYKLQDCSNKYSIRTSFLDLNIETDLAKELESHSKNVDLSKCMLACVCYRLELRWINEPRMIHLICSEGGIHSKYIDQLDNIVALDSR